MRTCSCGSTCLMQDASDSWLSAIAVPDCLHTRVLRVQIKSVAIQVDNAQLALQASRIDRSSRRRSQSSRLHCRCIAFMLHACANDKDVASSRDAGHLQRFVGIAWFDVICICIRRMPDCCVAFVCCFTHLSAPAQLNILLMRRMWNGCKRTFKWKVSFPEYLPLCGSETINNSIASQRCSSAVMTSFCQRLFVALLFALIRRVLHSSQTSAVLRACDLIRIVDNCSHVSNQVAVAFNRSIQFKWCSR